MRGKWVLWTEIYLVYLKNVEKQQLKKAIKSEFEIGISEAYAKIWEIFWNRKYQKNCWRSFFNLNIFSLARPTDLDWKSPNNWGYKLLILSLLLHSRTILCFIFIVVCQIWHLVIENTDRCWGGFQKFDWFQIEKSQMSALEGQFICRHLFLIALKRSLCDQFSSHLRILVTFRLEKRDARGHLNCSVEVLYKSALQGNGWGGFHTPPPPAPHRLNLDSLNLS